MTKDQIQQQIVNDVINSKSDYNLLLLPTGLDMIYL